MNESGQIELNNGTFNVNVAKGVAYYAGVQSQFTTSRTKAQHALPFV